MIATQDISSRFALDVQSVDKLRLQAKQDPDAALKAVAQQFEGIFMNMMLKSMREATTKDGMIDSEQGNLYTQLFDHQLAQKLSSGKGLGVADMMVKQLSRSQVPLTDETAVKKPLESDFALPKKDFAFPLPEIKDSPVSQANSPKEFVDKLWPHAAEAGKELGIPANFLIGHAALESGWGQREIRDAAGNNSYNLFGIKAGKKWTGPVVEAATTEYVNGVPGKTVERFRVYDSYAEAFRDYAGLLRNSPRYAPVLEQGLDAAGFARGLQQAGYATDPLYASKITRILNSQVMRDSLLT